QDFWSTAEFVLKTFPIPGISIVRDSEEPYDGDLGSLFDTAETQAATPGNIQPITRMLDTLRSAEGVPQHVTYVALIPGLPAKQAAGAGWSSDRLVITSVGDGPVMARELAHSYGYTAQAPCGDPPQPDPNFPVYKGYPLGSIGE